MKKPQLIDQARVYDQWVLSSCLSCVKLNDVLGSPSAIKCFNFTLRSEKKEQVCESLCLKRNKMSFINRRGD